MSVKVLEPEKKGKQKLKPKPPRKGEVLLHNQSNIPIPCAICVLKEVFRMSHGEAATKVQQASPHGVVRVFESSIEVCEQKAHDANFAASRRRFSFPCGILVLGVFFESRPQ